MFEYFKVMISFCGEMSDGLREVEQFENDQEMYFN